MKENKQMQWAIRVTFLALAPAAAENRGADGRKGRDEAGFPSVIQRSELPATASRTV